MIHTLSLALLSRHFKETELVTDELGRQIADRLGWEYQRYKINLRCLSPEMRHIWALGKIYAISIQNERFCHIDNDVLLFQPLPDRLLKEPIFAQSPDRPEFYVHGEMQRAIKSSSLTKIAAPTPYNTGIIGGDPNLLREYAQMAIGAAYRIEGVNGTDISMAIEQSWLGEFAQQRGYKVRTLLRVDSTEEEAGKAGYAHLVGKSKHLPEWQQRCEARLAHEFPAIYEKFALGWETIERADLVAA